MTVESARPLRVLFAIGSLSPGGSERQLVELLEATHPDRVDARVVSLKPAHDRSLESRLERVRIPHRSITNGGARPIVLARCAAGLGRVVRSLHPDLVYAWLEEASLVAAPATRAARIPLAVARRNISGGYASLPAPLFAAMRFAERQAIVVTANSEAVAGEAVRRGIAPERIRLVRNGHRPVPASEPSQSPEVRFGYMARFRSEKGHLRLLDALKEMRTPVPWRVDLAGDGPLLGEVQREVARRGLSERVRFVGSVEDPHAFWAGRDIALLLSDHEGSPNALIEAALAGRPLVATAVGGVPEIVLQRRTGLLVPPDSAATVGEALDALVEQPDLRDRLGAEARRLALDRYSMTSFVEGHLAAMRDAAGWR